MDQLIASFLFQNKICPLLHLGTLTIKQTSAELNFLNKSIASPLYFIDFSSTQNKTEALNDYISFKNKISTQVASASLETFCNTISNQIATQQTASIEGVGTFKKDKDDNIKFSGITLPEAFTQTINVEPNIIRTNANHNILVGNNETTSAVMTEYYSTENNIKKDRWWIWAIVLSAIAVTVLIIYLIGSDFSPRFGNTINFK